MFPAGCPLPAYSCLTAVTLRTRLWEGHANLTPSCGSTACCPAGKQRSVLMRMSLVTCSGVDARGPLSWACLAMCCSFKRIVCASRLEARAPREELLEELNAFTVGVDRPSYGQSDPHPRRSFQSWAEDVAHLADALCIQSFFVVGVRCAPLLRVCMHSYCSTVQRACERVLQPGRAMQTSLRDVHCPSGGGPYALATAHHLPDRVRGVLLLSPASSYGAPSACCPLHGFLASFLALRAEATITSIRAVDNITPAQA